jgi:hypothetical protein
MLELNTEIFLNEIYWCATVCTVSIQTLRSKTAIRKVKSVCRVVMHLMLEYTALSYMVHGLDPFGLQSSI